MTMPEEYEEEARIERAIKRGAIVECYWCGILTVPHFSNYEINYTEKLTPLCKKCKERADEEENHES